MTGIRLIPISYQFPASCRKSVSIRFSTGKAYIMGGESELKTLKLLDGLNIISSEDRKRLIHLEKEEK